MNPEINIEGLLLNDRSTQKVFFKHFYGYVMSIALRYSKSKEDADEICSDAFLKIFNRIHQYNQQFPLKPWISRIVVNTAIDKYRKDLSKIKLEPLELAADISAEPQNWTSKLDEGRQIITAIHTLPERYRLVFNLYVFEGYGHNEIAQKLEIAVGTSKSCLARARSIIRKELNNSKLKIHVNATGI